MSATILTAILSFISTNLDDIFVLMLFYAQEDKTGRKSQIMLGQYLGIGTLTALSLLGTQAVQLIPQHYIGLLGLVPIGLGIKEWIWYLREKKESGSAGPPDVSDGIGNDRPGLAVTVMLLAIANGADNLGVYIPLFAGYSTGQICAVVIIFAGMIALWCLLAQRIVSWPVLKNVLEKYKHILVPVIFVGLGVFILIENFI